MKVIAVVTQKGGAGKSTLVQELAVCAALKKQKVAIIDFDRQASVSQWGKDREQDFPVILPAYDKNLSEFIKLAKEKKYDYIFIDTGGKDDPTAPEAMKFADVCLVPTRPRKKDIFPAKVTINTSTQLNKDLVFVLNHTPPKLRKDLEMRAEALASYGTFCPVTIGNRVDFQDADDAGMGVMEINPSGKAAEEINNLWKWIVKHIKKNESSL